MPEKKLGWNASTMESWTPEKRAQVLKLYGQEGLTPNTYAWLSSRTKTDAPAERKINYKGILANPFIKGIDATLAFADRKGAHSHVTNAVRDIVNLVHNVPIKTVNAVYNKITSENPISFKEAYKQADVSPGKAAQLFLNYPVVNTAENYSEEELKAIKNLDLKSGGKRGQITHVGYRKHNSNSGESKYANDISGNNFADPYKVVEWSVGLTSQRTDDKGNKYLGDGFNFDTKDTEMYKLKIKSGEATPVMYARYLMGVLGSKGYSDGSNSSTAIQTRIPVSAYQKQGGVINYLFY